MIIILIFYHCLFELFSDRFQSKMLIVDIISFIPFLGPLVPYYMDENQLLIQLLDSINTYYSIITFWTLVLKFQREMLVTLCVLDAASWTRLVKKPWEIHGLCINALCVYLLKMDRFPTRQNSDAQPMPDILSRSEGIKRQ